MGSAGLAILGELDAIERVAGTRPPTCAWAAFYDPDVVAVLRAYDWHETGQLAEWWGTDPPYWLVLGVASYHRALARVRDATFRATMDGGGVTAAPRPPGELSIRR